MKRAIMLRTAMVFTAILVTWIRSYFPGIFNGERVFIRIFLHLLLPVFFVLRHIHLVLVSVMFFRFIRYLHLENLMLWLHASTWLIKLLELLMLFGSNLKSQTVHVLNIFKYCSSAPHSLHQPVRQVKVKVHKMTSF